MCAFVAVCHGYQDIVLVCVVGVFVWRSEERCLSVDCTGVLQCVTGLGLTGTPSPYRAVKRLSLGYKNQSVNVV